MSKVMLDTNILLDYIIPDRPESEYARLLMQGIAHQKHQGIVSASSLKDLYYVAAKSIGEQAARDWVCIFMRLCDVEELDVEICAIAAESDEPDFEDGCIRATAERACHRRACAGGFSHYTRSVGVCALMGEDVLRARFLIAVPKRIETPSCPPILCGAL